MQKMLCQLFALIIATTGSVKSSGEPIRCEGHAGGVSAIAFSPDGELVVSCGGKGLVRIWNATDGSEVRRLSVLPPDSDGIVSDAAFSPDGRFVAVAASRQPISFWNVTTGAKQQQSIAVDRAAHDLAYSPDGSKLAVAEYAAVKIWDLERHALVQEFKFDGVHIGLAWRVAYSPDGLLLAAALHDYGASISPKEPKVRAWNALTGEIAFTAWSGRSSSAVGISPDGSLLAAASGGTVEVWNLHSRKSLLRLAADEHAIFCLAFSPGGKTIATGGNDSKIKLWDSTTGKRVGLLKGHEGQVRGLCFSKDGKAMVSHGTDAAVLIWTLTTDATRE